MRTLAGLVLFLLCGVSCTPGKTVPEGPLTPVVASEWTRIVEYPENHLNDFCLFRDQEGDWHAIGIMGTGTWKSETSLFHSVGKDLTSRFRNLPPLFTRMPEWIGDNRSDNDSPQKHCPFVIYHDGLYHMLYRRPRGTNLWVRTPDPYSWPDKVELAFEERDARDPCIIRSGGKFLLYYCQSSPVEGVDRSCILLRESTDLRNWSPAKIVQYDTARETSHSKLESPFVVERPEGFYLFVRCRFSGIPGFTTVYFSRRHDQFPSGGRAWFATLRDTHAAEIITHEGETWIARVSGAPHASRGAEESRGWVEIAKLEFRQ